MGALLAGCAGQGNAPEAAALDQQQADRVGPELYAPPPSLGGKQFVAKLGADGKAADAALVNAMLNTPHAVWFTDGSPADVQHNVQLVVSRAQNQGTPVLVAYNVPFRDCAQYSAGGVASAADYAAWIDGFANGIGSSPAIVILEPDSLGVIPWFTSYWASGPDWCQIPTADPATAASDRLAMIRAAVARLNQQPNVKVYLDGTGPSWLGVGEITHRLLLAGVDQAAGFFLNVSNYEPTSNATHFGRWIGSCIALTQTYAWWDPSWCASQYAPDENGVYVQNYSDQHVADVYASYSWAPPPATRFVIDTSRNGQGAWTPPADHPAGDPQTWCNVPGRGLGLRPTTRTGDALVDAYLWVKIPGESDGECSRWSPVGGVDPVRGIMDPPAGAWFGDMALELVHGASPAL
jgi:endoglucanase